MKKAKGTQGSHQPGRTLCMILNSKLPVVLLCIIFYFKYINLRGFIEGLLISNTVKTTKMYVKTCAVD